MAKGKNKKMTIDDALVPAAEHPYEVPENWCWTRFKMVGTEFFDGDWILGENMDDNGEVRLLQLSDIGIGEFLNKSDKHISRNTFDELGCTELREGDVMVSRMAEPIARSCIVPKFDYPVITAVDVAVVRCRNEIVYNRYLNYLCNVKWFTDKAMSLSRGTTRTRITRANLGDIAIPIPPLTEQHRIVEQIESMFSKLDEAKEKAQSVLDSVEDRRLSILSEAFSGRLTTNWRNGKEASYETVLLSDLCTKITDGFHNSPKPVENGYPYVMAGCVKEQGIDYYNGLYMDEKNHRELYNKAHPERGDILMVNIGAGSGTAAVIDVDFEFSFKNSAILKLKKDMVNPYYVLYYLWLRKKYLLIEVTRGGAQPFLSLKIINNISIPLCDLEEQNEIVTIINSILQSENSIREKQEKVVESIDILKKSILAKAFRGELGTNIPEEESAEEILKKLIEK